MGLNSSLSSPTSEQVCLKEKRGGEVGRFELVNRFLFTDLSLKGFLTSGSTQAYNNFVSSYYEFI